MVELRDRVPRKFLVPFPVLSAILGLAYLWGDAARTATRSFAAAKYVAPMPVWGIVFLAGAVAIATALATNQMLASTLFVGGLVYSWWAVCFMISALTDPTASVTARAIHGFISAAHYLTALHVRTSQ